MNKILIGVIVVISVYIGYSSLSSNENTTKSEVDTSTITLNANEEVTDIVEEPAYKNEQTTLDGRFVLNIENDLVKSSQAFDFSSNGTFELSREMIAPKAGLGGNVKGTYTIKDNTVQLVFPKERNTEAFPLDKAEMIIISESELDYGGYIAKLN